MKRPSTSPRRASFSRQSALVELAHLRPVLVEEIHRLHPETRDLKSVPHEFVTEARMTYVQSVMEDELGELSAIENQVVRSLAEHDLLSRNLEEDFAEQRTLGERIADKVAEFGGSWTFIGLFALVLIAWVLINVLWLRGNAFDPYPFILMNLILSCLAALQAPVIMMSQKRAEARDRARSWGLATKFTEYLSEHLARISHQHYWQKESYKKVNRRVR